MLPKQAVIGLFVYLVLVSTTGMTKCAELNTFGDGTTQSSSTTISNGVTQSSDSTMFLFDFVPLSETEQWCKLENGTSFSQGFSFMDDRCSVCQCLANHSISCKKIFCMLTYCIDGSKAEVREGQCCPQYSYEKTPQTCEYKNLTLKHGTAIKRTAENVYCWCQSGSIECGVLRMRRASTYSPSNKPSLSLIIGLTIGGISIVGVLLFGIGWCLFKRLGKKRDEVFAEFLNDEGWRAVGAPNVVLTGGRQKIATNSFALHPIYTPPEAVVSEAAP